MKTFTKLLANERGMILVISLMILALLLGAGVGAIVSMQTDLRTSSNLKTGKQAFYIADAGVNRAWKELDDGNGTNDFDSLSGSVTLYSNVSYASGSYTVTAEVQHPGSSTQPIIPKRVKVTSTGCYPAVTGTGSCPAGSAKVVIEAQFRRESLFNCAACAKDSVSITGGSTTNSYDSRTGAYGGSNVGSDGDVGSNGTITLSGSPTVVYGDASALTSVTTSGGATVTGTTTNLTAPIEFPPVSHPCGSPYAYSSGSGITGGTYNSANGQLRGTGSANVTLANGTYCFSSVDLAGQSTLTVNGSVKIYLTADSNFTGGGVVNTTGLPENLQIFSLFSSSSQGISVSGGSQTAMAIYAPDCRVALSGGSNFYGAIVGKSIDISGGTAFHYDKRLEDNVNGEIAMVSWRQVF